MTESNPFGGLDLNALMQQAQAVQQQVVAAQQELAERTVDGTVGDGLVSVTVNGNGDLVGVKIRSGSFDPDDTEDLEDLLVAAYRDARARADAMAAQALDPLAGGLDLGNLGLGGLGPGAAGGQAGDGPGQDKPALGF
jgi:DNA-binding YbaB/EbfC family protein